MRVVLTPLQYKMLKSVPDPDKPRMAYDLGLIGASDLYGYGIKTMTVSSAEGSCGILEYVTYASCE